MPTGPGGVFEPKFSGLPAARIAGCQGAVGGAGGVPSGWRSAGPRPSLAPRR